MIDQSINQKSQCVAHTHHLPRHWRGRAHTAEVQAAFNALFQYKVRYRRQYRAVQGAAVQVQYMGRYGSQGRYRG